MDAIPKFLFPPSPYEAALDKALSDAEGIQIRLREAQEAVTDLEVGAEQLWRLITTLAHALPEDRRELYRARAVALQPPTKASRGTSTYENVIRLFANENRREWSAPEVQQALAARGTPVADPDQVSNVMHYLARKGRIKRTSRGRYVLIDYGISIETGEDLFGARQSGDECK